MMVRGLVLAAALALTACGPAKKCNTNADCATGQTCNTASGTCGTGGGGGTTGGGGGTTGGGGGGTTGGGGGATGGGGGGGATGGGGGTTDGGTGGGGGSVMMGGESCADALAITSGTPVTGQDSASAMDDYDGTGMNCEGSDAPDRTYSISVAPSTKLTVVVTPDMAFDPTVSLSDSAANCNVTCLTARDNGADGDPETVTYTNTGTTPVTVFIVVDGYMGSAGAYELTATTETVMLATCAQAVTLTSGTPATMQAITTYASSYGSVTGCAHSSSGPDRAYRVSVPGNQVLNLTVTPDGTSTLDLAISLAESEGQCGVACLARADEGLGGDPETLMFLNPTSTTQEYLVVIDSWGTGMGTFTINYTTMAPPPDDTCGGMLTTLTSTPLTGQTTVGYINDYETDGTETACNPPSQFSNGDTGADRVYAFNIGANQRATLTATPSAMFNPSLTVMANAAACTAMPRTCLTAFNAAGDGEAETIRLTNATDAGVSYLAVVDSASGSGTFDLGLTLDTPPADDVCGTATALTAGTVMGNFTGFVNDYGTASNNCLAFASADRVYRANVPAGQKLTNAITPTVADGGLDIVINYVPGTALNCETLPRTCAGGADFQWDQAMTGLATGETGAYTNSTNAAQDVFVIVGNYAASASTDFSMTTTIAAAPAGETCANAVPVTAATMLTMESLAGASSDVTFDTTQMMPTCLVANGLPDRVYAVTVPAGQTMTAVATPVMGVNVAINVFQGACTNVATCLSNVNAGAAGAAETATYMNATGMPATIFVQVIGVPPGAYTMNFTIQ